MDIKCLGKSICMVSLLKTPVTEVQLFIHLAEDFKTLHQYLF